MSQPPRSSLVRIGYWMCGAGLAVTFAGTILLGMNNLGTERIGSAVHQSGLLFLLVSFTVVLLGYRMNHIRQWCERMQNNSSLPDAGGEVPQRAVTRGEAVSLWVNLRGLILVITTGILTVVLSASGPRGFGFMLFFYGQTLYVAILLVEVVFDRGLLRAFCLGALVPALLILLSRGWFEYSAWAQSPRGYGNPFAFTLAVFANWGGGIVIGLICVVARLWIAGGAKPEST